MQELLDYLTETTRGSRVQAGVGGGEWVDFQLDGVAFRVSWSEIERRLDLYLLSQGQKLDLRRLLDKGVIDDIHNCRVLDPYVTYEKFVAKLKELALNVRRGSVDALSAYNAEIAELRMKNLRAELAEAKKNKDSRTILRCLSELGDARLPSETKLMHILSRDRG